MQRSVNGLTIECVQGDITQQPDCEAIVNAANSKLAGGGGVDGAIHRAAGPELVKASRALGPIKAGEAVITEAFELPNSHVIHCVGPVYHADKPVAEQLASCYTRAMQLAAEAGATKVAFPAISTGVYGYPLAEASRVAMRAVADCAAQRGSVELARFVLFSEQSLAAFNAALDGV
ncbi:MAG TPA: O-acetyl-ADP-ribose deacetylase [Salinisphaeraceae bacterium]|nr:O-acetyl-ADP-ribose deacetylase [Salinisphaeraceae bacterium]